MTQILVPGFPEGAERINTMLSILRQDKWVTYFVGSDNYFSHAQDDAAGERFALSSLMANRHVRAKEMERSARQYSHPTAFSKMVFESDVVMDGTDSGLPRHVKPAHSQCSVEFRSLLALRIKKWVNRPETSVKKRNDGFPIVRFILEPCLKQDVFSAFTATQDPEKLAAVR
jgi:hypothetical protein